MLDKRPLPPSDACGFHTIKFESPYSSDSDATQIFDAFHEGSTSAYKQLRAVEKLNRIDFPGPDPTLKQTVSNKEINVGVYDISIEREKRIVLSFEKLRQKVIDEGLMERRPWFFVRFVDYLLYLNV